MKFCRAIFAFILFLVPFHSPASSFNMLDDIAFTGKKWKSFTPCQKLFILGYASYMSGRYKEAEEDFKICDGRYPVLQGHINEFVRLSREGGERFAYIDRAKEALSEAEVVKREPPSPRRDFDLAKAYFRARRYADAAEWFGKASEDGRQRLAALEYLATSLARQEKYDEAIDVQERIIGEYPRDKGARAKALYKIAFLQMDSGRYGEASDTYKRLRREAPGYQKQQVEWNLAWCAYKTGDFGGAGEHFEKLEKNGKDWGIRAKFWRARSLIGAGDKNGGERVLREINEKNGLSYYGILAGKELGERPSVAEGAEETDENGEGLAISPAEGAGGGDVLSAALELDRLGITDLVAEELEGVIASSAKAEDVDLQAVYELARRNDAWHVVNYLARKYKGAFPREGAYPKAYQRAVQAVAKKRGVDPLFVWAIMREESAFRPAAVSPSGAVGLMQLMPFTAERMMGFSFPVQNLTRPKFNIDAGVRYLSFLLKRYDGNKFLSAAAYNAGEEAVDRWVGQRVTDKAGRPALARGKCPFAHGAAQFNSEEFAEEVPYKETHAYVKKVMRAYWIYRAMYE